MTQRVQSVPPGCNDAEGDAATLRLRLARCEAELAAVRSQCAEAERLRAVVDASPMVAIRWRMEPGWPVEYVSENIRRFGYSATELMSGAVSWFAVLQPAEGTEPLPPVETPELVGGYRLLSYALRCRPEGRRVVRFVVRTTRNEHGQLVCEGLFREAAQRLEDEERLRLLEKAVNTATNGIVIADAGAPDLPVIFANRAVKRISGYEPEEFLGRNCRFLQGGETGQPALQQVREALRQGRSCEVVLRNRRKNGTLFWNEIRLSPVANRSGEVTHFIGIQADITARKHVEAALARRDAILEAVSRAAETLLRHPDYEQALPATLRQIGEVTGADDLWVWREGVTGHQRTMTLVEAWRAGGAGAPVLKEFQEIPWEEAAGWPSAVALRRGRWVQGGPRDCSPEERRLVERLGMRSFLCLPIFAGPDQFWGVLTLAGRREGVVWARIEVEALLSATRVLGAVIRNRAMSVALSASEQRFRSLVHSLKEVVFQADAQGTWTFLNRAWTEVTGFELADAIGRPVLEFVHPDDRERHTRMFEPLVRRQKEYSRHRVRYVTRAGGFRWIEVFARLTLDDQDQITGTAGTLTDVSAQVDAEETRRRTAERIERSLHEKEVMLKEIHHRVKNNMQIVSSLLNLQLEHVHDPATRSLFVDSQNRIASMALVHEKLYQSSDLGRIDFAEYVRDLLDNLVSSVGPAGGAIRFRLESGELHLGIDTAIPCGLMINELVSNAYKHAFPQGGPGTIDVRLAPAPAGGLVLEVADSGCGLPAGLDWRQTRTLGLQLVHTLVQQLCGTIEVRRGAGTRFVLHLQAAPLSPP